MSGPRAARRPPVLLCVVALTTTAMLVVLGYVLLSLGQITGGLSTTRIVAAQTANGQRDLLLFQHAVDRLALGDDPGEAVLRRGLALQQLQTVARQLEGRGGEGAAADLVQRLRAMDVQALAAAPDRVAAVRAVDARLTAIEREFKVLYDDGDMNSQRVTAKALSARAGAQRLLAGLIALTLVLALATALQARRRTRSDLRLAYEAVRASERRFASLARNASDLTLLTDAHGAITYASPALIRLTGIAPEDAVGRTLASLGPAPGTSVVGAVLARLLAGESERTAVEFTLLGRDATPITLDGTAMNLLADPAVEAVVFNVRDVTERRRLEGELARLAFHDPLTGLANRALLHDRIAHAASRAARAPEHGAALVLIDLDDFKAVNDGLGHGAGDRLLIAVARRLEDAMRAEDTVVRLGGDEFVVFAEHLSGRADAAELATRVLAALAAPFAIGAGEYRCRASVGVRFISSQDLDAEALLRDADLAMYSAKGAGKGSWALFAPEMHDSASDTLALRSDLHQAVERDELRLHYQPIVDLEAGRVLGFEALVRWHHPQRGLIGPDRFIGLAEATGLIAPLGAWVLREATAALCRMARANGDDDLTMSVNLSPVQLQTPDIVGVVAAALDRSGLEPHRLVLEVTENVFLGDSDVVTERLQALRALGVRIALDDFGTGFSSLAYLERLPLDVLKIDRHFVASVADDRARTTIVAAIAQLAHGLGLTTVAEGIETREQLETMRALGCDRGQGHLFAPALPEPAAGAFLETQAVLAAVVATTGWGSQLHS